MSRSRPRRSVSSCPAGEHVRIHLPGLCALDVDCHGEHRGRGEHRRHQGHRHEPPRPGAAGPGRPAPGPRRGPSQMSWRAAAGLGRRARRRPVAAGRKPTRPRPSAAATSPALRHRRRGRPLDRDRLPRQPAAGGGGQGALARGRPVQDASPGWWSTRSAGCRSNPPARTSTGKAGHCGSAPKAAAPSSPPTHSGSSPGD